MESYGILENPSKPLRLSNGAEAANGPAVSLFYGFSF